MKKAIIKFVFTLFILAIIFFAIFVVGYVQFFVPLGKYGVFLSKTSGYHKELITHEEFLWRWESLIPTNSKVLLFSLSPITIEKKMEGKLEHANKYAMFLKNEPNFSWKVDIGVRFEIKKEMLVAFLKEANIKDEDALLEYLKEGTENVVANAIEDCILFYQENDNRCNKFLFKKRLKNAIERAVPKLLNCRITMMEVALPDFYTYRSARSVAQEYARAKQDILISKIEKLRGIQQNIEELSKNIEQSIFELEKVLKDDSVDEYLTSGE